MHTISFEDLACLCLFSVFLVKSIVAPFGVKVCNVCSNYYYFTSLNGNFRDFLKNGERSTGFVESREPNLMTPLEYISVIMMYEILLVNAS